MSTPRLPRLERHPAFYPPDDTALPRPILWLLGGSIVFGVAMLVALAVTASGI